MGQTLSTTKKRIGYLIATLLLLVVEVVIALFVHDTVIRPYVGDVLVVIVIYTMIRSVVPDKGRYFPLYIFLFAAGVEWLQFIGIVEMLGMESNTFLRVLIGSVFDVKDIICYAIGCILLGVYEFKMV